MNGWRDVGEPVAWLGNISNNIGIGSTCECVCSLFDFQICSNVSKRPTGSVDEAGLCSGRKPCKPVIVLYSA